MRAFVFYRIPIFFLTKLVDHIYTNLPFFEYCTEICNLQDCKEKISRLIARLNAIQQPNISMDKSRCKKAEDSYCANDAYVGKPSLAGNRSRTSHMHDVAFRIHPKENHTLQEPTCETKQNTNTHQIRKGTPEKAQRGSSSSSKKVLLPEAGLDSSRAAKFRPTLDNSSCS